MTNKYKEALEKIATMMDEEPYDPQFDGDFNPMDRSGGNFDDAWRDGNSVGYDAGVWAVVQFAREVLASDQ